MFLCQPLLDVLIGRGLRTSIPSFNLHPGAIFQILCRFPG
jgi:hypothetical protein